MSNAANVISLAKARRAKERIKIDSLPHDRLIEKTICLAHRYVSPGAFLLLTQVVRFLHLEKAELSYTFLCRELRVSDRTLTRYIEELEDTSFIRVRRSRVGKVMATNQFEIDFNGPLGAPMPKLPEPRKPRSGGYRKNYGTGVPEKVRSNNISTIGTVGFNNSIPKGIERCAPGFKTVAEALAFSEKRVRRSRAKKVTRVGSQLTLAGVKATWANAMLYHYPKVPAVTFSSKEFAILKMKLAPMLAICNLSEFFDYIVSSWNALRETKFIWLRVKGKDLAIAPSLPELMRYFKVFAKAFADSRMQEANSKARSHRTRREVLTDLLATEKAAKARLQADVVELKDRLIKAEKIAYGVKVPAPRQQLSLSARQKALGERYNDEVELPTWK